MTISFFSFFFLATAVLFLLLLSSTFFLCAQLLLLYCFMVASFLWSNDITFSFLRFLVDSVNVEKGLCFRRL